MNEKLVELKEKITSLWKVNLKATDFEKDLKEYLSSDEYWNKSVVKIDENVLNLKLYTDEVNGFDIKITMKKSTNT